MARLTEKPLNPSGNVAQTWSNPERWLTAIVDSSNSAIVGESLDGTIMTWNAAACRIFGYTAEEAIGMPVFALAWPGEEEQSQGLLHRVRRGERINNLETSRKHKEGRRVFVSLTLFPIRDENGEIVGIAKISTDITDRKFAQMEEARTRAELISERKYREVIEHAPDAILEIDAKGLIVIANQTAERFFGYTREDLLGAPIEMLIPEAHNGYRASRRAAFVEAGQVRPVEQGLELNARRKDGTEFPIEISLSPIFLDNSVQIVAVIRDVTQRRRTEQQMRALQEGYLTEISARRVEAERLNRLKSEFLASVSHELRTPLHTIIGFTDLLREDPQHTLSVRQYRFVENIQRDSEHLLELINDVLDLSRIEAGGLTVQPEQLSLAKVFAQTVDGLRISWESKGLRVSFSCEPDLQLLADPTRLRQILSNLISNAIKFTNCGGAISIKGEQEQSFARISVQDTGIGIPAEELSNIFGKFYQVGVTTGGVREGTGLGLAICKELVAMHRGEITVSSQVGCGSTFSFTIPLS
jgi:PAS domain S-box-containing protein